ncbi:MAG: hypothetical protein D6689_01830 [Deltaproteobacteria bacterium]|nr:MAG: hypothetical protein D6689_01830 [Deltaproteobacteria bacterium]
MSWQPVYWGPTGGRARIAPARLRGWAIRVAAAWAAAFAAGCPTVDLGQEPPAPALCRPDRAYFDTELWPNLIAAPDAPYNCVAAGGCHERASGRSALRLIVNDPPSPGDLQQNYDVVTRFLNCGTPGASPFLTKPLAGVDPHGGGDLIEPGSMAEEIFCAWFPDGC